MSDEALRINYGSKVIQPNVGVPATMIAARSAQGPKPE